MLSDLNNGIYASRGEGDSLQNYFDSLRKAAGYEEDNGSDELDKDALARLRSQVGQ